MDGAGRRRDGDRPCRSGTDLDCRAIVGPGDARLAWLLDVEAGSVLAFFVGLDVDHSDRVYGLDRRDHVDGFDHVD